MKRLYVFILLLLIICSCKKTENNDAKPYVIILSMDGFRWDYPEKTSTPNLDNIEEIGVRAEASVPCFPTKTFPNHYSIVTGLYPENHGIIFNNFYANDLNKNYSIGNSEAVVDSSFYFGEPIWVTAEKQGVKSASYFWVGSEALHSNIFPSYHYPYDRTVPFESRIDTVINWLKLPEDKRPHLILWYLQEPDWTGHELGPDNPGMEGLISNLDSLVGVFYAKVEELEIADQTNVIITSDHGMSQISKDRIVYLDGIIPMEWINHLDGGNPVYSIDIKDKYYDKAFKLLTNEEHIKCWKKSEVPGRLHFTTSERIKDFVVVADSSWSLLISSENYTYFGGAHGYDNQNKDMHAIFYAYGPAFKENYKHNSIYNIDIYPLICKILKLDSPEVDGKIENVEDMLEKSN